MSRFNTEHKFQLGEKPQHNIIRQSIRDMIARLTSTTDLVDKTEKLYLLQEWLNENFCKLTKAEEHCLTRVLVTNGIIE